MVELSVISIWLDKRVKKEQLRTKMIQLLKLRDHTLHEMSIQYGVIKYVVEFQKGTIVSEMDKLKGNDLLDELDLA